MKTVLLSIVLAVLALGTSSALADATLRVGDTFELRIGGVPSDDTSLISSNYTIDGEGCLNLPYINKVSVVHLTVSAVQAAVERAYISQGIFTHPTVTVNIAPGARFVNVSGQVRSPQRVGYTPDMTVMSAINAAGDFTEFANQKKVHLTRDGKVTFVNCAKARGNPDLDVKVLPGDSIQIEQSFW